MPTPLDEALARLEAMRQPHLAVAAAMLKAYGTSLYGADLMCLTALNRSLAHIGVFVALIREKNFICAASLVRLQLDTLLRLRALWLVEHPHDFAIQVMGGERIDKMKDQRGNLMRDFYLVESMKGECPWVESVYRETSGYIHLSSKHYSNAIRIDEHGHLEGRVGGVDVFVVDDDRLEAVRCFIEVTARVFRYVEDWTFTKANPEIATELRRQIQAQRPTDLPPANP